MRLGGTPASLMLSFVLVPLAGWAENQTAEYSHLVFWPRRLKKPEAVGGLGAIFHLSRYSSGNRKIHTMSTKCQ